MTVLTAARVLARFNYKRTDFDPDNSTPDEDTSLTNVEYIIDDCIDYVNSEAGASISNLSGTSPDKTVTVTGAQNAALMILLEMMLRDSRYTASSSSHTLGPASVSESVGQQPMAVQGLLEKALDRLRGRTILRT